MIVDGPEDVDHIPIDTKCLDVEDFYLGDSSVVDHCDKSDVEFSKWVQAR